MRFKAEHASWELVTVRGVPMLFTEFRIDRTSVPEGLYMYEVRHADEDSGDPAQIAKWVMVNYFGTLISAIELPLEFSAQGHNAYLDIDSESEWEYCGFTSSLQEYRKEFDI